MLCIAILVLLIERLGNKKFELNPGRSRFQWIKIENSLVNEKKNYHLQFLGFVNIWYYGTSVLPLIQRLLVCVKIIKKKRIGKTISVN